MSLRRQRAPFRKYADCAVARHHALQRHLRVAGVLAGQLAVGVVEHQLDRRRADRLARAGAVEDDVGHRIAAQVLGRDLAHHPAHGVDDVGLAAAVGADDADQVAGEVDGGRVDEGLEPGQLDLVESHRALEVRPCMEIDVGTVPLPRGSVCETPRMRVDVARADVVRAPISRLFAVPRRSAVCIIAPLFCRSNCPRIWLDCSDSAREAPQDGRQETVCEGDEGQEDRCEES